MSDIENTAWLYQALFVSGLLAHHWRNHYEQLGARQQDVVDFVCAEFERTGKGVRQIDIARNLGISQSRANQLVHLLYKKHLLINKRNEYLVLPVGHSLTAEELHRFDNYRYFGTPDNFRVRGQYLFSIYCQDKKRLARKISAAWDEIKKTKANP